MKNIYVLIAVLALVIGVAAFALAFTQKQQASLALEKTIADLRNVQNTVSIENPNNTNNPEMNLGRARSMLANAASRVSRIKGGIAGNVSGKSDAIRTIEQARSELRRIEEQSVTMIQANAEFMIALTNLQSQYEVKISELERQISELKNKKTGISFEYLAGIMGLLTAFSTLLLGWRKDNREVDELKLEVAKFKATSI